MPITTPKAAAEAIYGKAEVKSAWFGYESNTDDDDNDHWGYGDDGGLGDYTYLNIKFKDGTERSHCLGNFISYNDFEGLPSCAFEHTNLSEPRNHVQEVLTELALVAWYKYLKKPATILFTTEKEPKMNRILTRLRFKKVLTTKSKHKDSNGRNYFVYAWSKPSNSNFPAIKKTTTGARKVGHTRTSKPRKDAAA